MPRTHPYIRGLAETRARTDSQCATLEAQITTLSRRLEKARTERDACDSLIRRFNPCLLPAAIQPITEGQRTQYGQRGALTKAILAALQQAYPESITTSAIALHVEAAFRLTFSTRTERRNWVCKSISNRLSSFARDNIIERLHNPCANTGQTGLWRWIPKGGPSADLQSLAGAAGIPVIQACSADQLEFASMLEPTPEEDDRPR